MGHYRVHLLDYFIDSLKCWTKRYSAEFGSLTGRIGVLYGDLQGVISPMSATSRELGEFPFRPLVSQDVVLD